MFRARLIGNVSGSVVCLTGETLKGKKDRVKRDDMNRPQETPHNTERGRMGSSVTWSDAGSRDAPPPPPAPLSSQRAYASRRRAVRSSSARRHVSSSARRRSQSLDISCAPAWEKKREKILKDRR
eukprot:31031-Pelagococcus_subviridis.AAC.10